MKPLEQRIKELEEEHIRLIDQVVDMANGLEEAHEKIVTQQRNLAMLLDKLLRSD